MSILSHHITRQETPAVRKALAALGYEVTTADCYAYTVNLANQLEGMDPAAQNKVIAAISAAVSGDNRTSRLIAGGAQ